MTTQPLTKYDENNIFARVLRAHQGSTDPTDLKFKKDPEKDIVYEDDNTLAFPDIAPHAKKHVLVIPKKSYIGFDDFISNNTRNDAEIADYFRAVYNTAKSPKVGLGENFRLLCNNGELAGQTVAHLHFHILGGQKMPALEIGQLPGSPTLPARPKEVLNYQWAKADCYKTDRQPPLNYVVVKPKNHYTNFAEFIGKGSDAEIAGFFRALHTSCHAYGLGTGFRIISSNGKDVGQKEPGFNMQVLIGSELGKLLPDKSAGVRM